MLWVAISYPVEVNHIVLDQIFVYSISQVWSFSFEIAMEKLSDLVFVDYPPPELRTFG